MTDTSLTPYQRRVVEALKSTRRYLSYEDISAMAYVSVKTLSHMMKILRELGYARVAKWERNLGTSGCCTPLFTLKRGKPDAPKPAPIPVTERTRAWKKRNHYAHKRYLREGIPAFGRAKPKNPTAVIDPLVAAVMGGTDAGS